MKLYSHIKKIPEDFVVEEVPALKVVSEGAFDVFILKKRNVSTLEAVRIISKLLKFSLKSIGFAGLKDKYAVTTQYITVPSGKITEEKLSFYNDGRWRVGKRQSNSSFEIKFIGKSKKPLTIGNIYGNKFTIKIRNFEKSMREKFYRNLQTVKLYGFPNYFGEQRFGSVKSRDDFVLRYILKGDFVKALKVYFLGKEKIDMLTDWQNIYKVLKPTLEEYEKDLLRGLLKGLPAEKAFRILPKNIRVMFNFAFQSYLFNRILGEYILNKYSYRQVPFINNWKLYFYLEVPDFEYFKNLQIPYTGKNLPPEDSLLKKVMKKVFKEEKVTPSVFDMEIAGMKVMTDGQRKAVVIPENFKIVSKTKKDVTIQFILPPGSYATILLRALLSV
ncbi:tRNA pseudouridine(13) synthase TruD [Desulfurobacterium sp.]|uniref:tRNA pseudouridine(13) synthase TruD n=1 Tax=Desulfurobacterium sp. TaxID=2004706 RepID=UPI00262AAA66|nr:tRNA pseudouridine(13) synthase TruD [Desulfurobacterium sp.]